MQHLLTGVSATALTVAAARAIATRSDELDDPFAARFVEASGHEELPLSIDDASLETRPFWEGIARYLARRTRAFDEALLEATAHGARQVVLVAAGLDARAFRLEWPAGTRLFEIDRAPVLEFKQRVLDGADARPRAERRTIASDVAHDWPAALAVEGFAVDTPTAWLVEGLLPYLPADLETSLIDRIDRLSAPGSSLALEFIRRPDDVSSLGPRSTQILSLFDAGPRPDTEGMLRDAGWSVRTEVADRLSSWSFARR